MRTPPQLRLSKPGDINDLTTLDLKCYHYPLNMTSWRELLRESGKPMRGRVTVAEYGRYKIGFAVWLNLDKETIEIMRLGVHPDYRRRGIGSLLLSKIMADAQHQQAKTLRITAPDIHCEPGHPDDVSDFLINSGFKTTGEVVSDFKRMYGDMVEGYIFEMRLK